MLYDDDNDEIIG